MIIFVSDFHVGKGDGSEDFRPDAERAFVKLGNKYPRAEFVFVGDTFELWQARSYEIMAAHPYFLDVILEMGRQAVFVEGNHDPSLGFLQGVRLAHQTAYLETDAGGVIAIHGHQYDGPNRGKRSLGRLIAGMIGYAERWGWENVDETLGQLWNAVNYNAERYEEKLVKLAEHEDCQFVVYGHTHWPYIKRIPEKSPIFIGNCGSWTQRFLGGYPYLELDDTLRLRYIE